MRTEQEWHQTRIAAALEGRPPLAVRKRGRGQGARKRRQRDRRIGRMIDRHLDALLDAARLSGVFEKPLCLGCAFCPASFTTMPTSAIQDPMTGEWFGVCDDVTPAGLPECTPRLSGDSGHRWMYVR